MAYIDLSQRPDEGGLQDALNRIFASVDQKEVAVGYSVDACSAFAEVNAANAARSAGKVRFETGCLTKLFTAALLEEYAADSTLSFDSEVARFFSSGSAQLAEITIRSLLDHTHGLDDSLCTYLPRKDEFIDAEKLVEQCAEHRISRPGEIYSYSNAGARIIAATLEAICEAPYFELLQRHVFEQVGIAPGHEGGSAAAGEICPARGGILAVTLAEMMQFLESLLARKEFWPENDDESGLTPIPGWNPFERGVYRGWKYYGDGWFGHSSITEDRKTALVRVNPATKTAVTIVSTYHHASLVAAKLFGKELPGFRSLRIPKPLSSSELEGVDLGAYQGHYRNASEEFSIVVSDAGGLKLLGRYEVELVPAEDGVLLPRRPKDSGMGFVQLVQPRGGIFRYLWDGQRLYRNSRV